MVYTYTIDGKHHFLDTSSKMCVRELLVSLQKEVSSCREKIEKARELMQMDEGSSQYYESVIANANAKIAELTAAISDLESYLEPQLGDEE